MAKKPTVRETIEMTRVYRRQANNLADHLHRRKMAYSDDDLYAIIMYCSSQQRCIDFDKLSDWAKMAVDTLPLGNNDLRYIPEVQ